jgi:hypothetical protein
VPTYWPCGVRYSGGVTLIRARVRNLRTLQAMPRENPISANRVSASLQLGWRVARLNVADDGVVRGRSNGDCLASKPMEEQTSRPAEINPRDKVTGVLHPPKATIRANWSEADTLSFIFKFWQPAVLWLRAP